jgi:hypothetical protein
MKKEKRAQVCRLKGCSSSDLKETRISHIIGRPRETHFWAESKKIDEGLFVVESDPFIGLFFLGWKTWKSKLLPDDHYIHVTGFFRKG